MTRVVTVRTRHDRPDLVAEAVRPDNTTEMDTDVRCGRVVTRIERETTAGVHSTVDDYLVNLDVATRVLSVASTVSSVEPAGTAADATETSTTESNSTDGRSRVSDESNDKPTTTHDRDTTDHQ